MAGMGSRELVRRLVGFDTTSRESNLALIDFVRDYLDQLGVACELSHDETGTKANLFATIGDDRQGGICLSGHTDVVPVDDQNWSSDPFAVAERQSKLFGRGVADMKSFLAVMLAKAPAFVAKRSGPPVHLAFTFDEEVGCLGVRHLIAQLERREVKPLACIIGEPTSMQPITGHKGKRSIRCEVHGHECHSALAHEGANAVEAAAELIAYMKGMARRFRNEGPFDPAYVPPYTTVHTGRVIGGTALNIVPKHAEFLFEIRNLPGHDSDPLMQEIFEAARRLLPEMKAVTDEAAIDFHEISAMAALATPEDAGIVRLVQHLTGANGTGTVSYGTEGGAFQTAGIPTVICGPGNIVQAHKPDEWIELDQIVQCEAFMDRLVDRMDQDRPLF
ncbi:MAG TPA: acetylornithine deacetylase [Stellaceae bacterium]|nr:acetylornithine deacetylase [Stellaceae bacterium]